MYLSRPLVFEIIWIIYVFDLDAWKCMHKSLCHEFVIGCVHVVCVKSCSCCTQSCNLSRTRTFSFKENNLVSICLTQKHNSHLLKFDHMRSFSFNVLPSFVYQNDLTHDLMHPKHVKKRQYKFMRSLQLKGSIFFKFEFLSILPNMFSLYWYLIQIGNKVN